MNNLYGNVEASPAGLGERRRAGACVEVGHAAVMSDDGLEGTASMYKLAVIDPAQSDRRHSNAGELADPGERPVQGGPYVVIET